MITDTYTIAWRVAQLTMDTSEGMGAHKLSIYHKYHSTRTPIRESWKQTHGKINHGGK